MTMKTNGWMIFGLMIAAGAPAQDNTNTLPPMPAPLVAPAVEQPAETPSGPPGAKPATPAHKKHVAAAKPVPLVEPPVTLLPGMAEVTVASLNVRGQAGLKGEVIGKLAKGDAVAVISQENLAKHQVGEPEQWAKIGLPATTRIWVYNRYLDATNNTVLPKKLNLRSGPGENYSVLGTIEQGASVRPVTTKGDWTQIEPPVNACGFVAAMYLKQQASGTLVTNPAPSTETVPTPTAVTEGQPITTEPGAAAGAAGASGVAANGAGTAAPNETANANPNESVNPASGPAGLDTNAAALGRIVSHEGVVGGAGSLIAPTPFVLFDPETSKDINFLYTTSPTLNLQRYYGMRIIATGSESLAERWPETPVLTVERIEVLQTNVLPKAYYPTPRQRH